jgi:hypothetical protein
MSKLIDSVTHLLDPVVGGRARTILNTLFGAFVGIAALYPSWAGQTWYQIVTILAAALLFPGVGGVTHLTSVGNVPPVDPNTVGH